MHVVVVGREVGGHVHGGGSPPPRWVRVRTTPPVSRRAGPRRRCGRAGGRPSCGPGSRPARARGGRPRRAVGREVLLDEGLALDERGSCPASATTRRAGRRGGAGRRRGAGARAGGPCGRGRRRAGRSPVAGSSKGGARGGRTTQASSSAITASTGTGGSSGFVLGARGTGGSPTYDGLSSQCCDGRAPTACGPCARPRRWPRRRPARVVPSMRSTTMAAASCAAGEGGELARLGDEPAAVGAPDRAGRDEGAGEVGDLARCSGQRELRGGARGERGALDGFGPDIARLGHGADASACRLLVRGSSTPSSAGRHALHAINGCRALTSSAPLVER